MSPYARRASSPGPGPSHPFRLSGLSPPQSDTVSPAESQVDLTGSPASHTSWRNKLHSSIHWGSPKKKTSHSRLELDWERTRLRVGRAVGEIIQVTGDHALPIVVEALSVAPLPGLSAAAKILDSIWRSLQLVQTNRAACLRLTERCADLLIAIHDEVLESGDQVVHELKAPWEKLEQSFSDFDRFLKLQAELSFFTRYLKKDEILREIAQCDVSVRDCLDVFNLAIGVRILKRVLKGSTQDTSLLLGPVETNPPAALQPNSEGALDALDLAIFPTNSNENSPQDDMSSLSEKLRHVQETENEADRARDLEDLGRVVDQTLNARNRLEVLRQLQIQEPDMPAAIILLLRELERQQQREQPNNPASGSPSPLIRALTWPLDGTPARALLHRQFIEFQLETFRRSRSRYVSSTPPLVTERLRRAPSRTEIQVYPPSESEASTSDYSATAITTSPANASLIGVDPALDRPSDPFEAKTEIRYRMSISHAFHHRNVSVPLWTPSPVALGAVGYLLKPAGAFRTLFNCRNPSETSNGRLSAIPRLTGTTIMTLPEDSRGMKAKGMKIIDRLTSAKSSIKRTYEISASADTAHLIVHKAEYQYFQDLDPLKRWFRANAQSIMNTYHPECLREELCLVYATVNARDHALIVNHGGDSDKVGAILREGCS
ncbi:hypothetical protein FB451DRAFT_1246991 [Mycena latifolia]|nr:hypothetical protein FB451DRAFT_1246991 [Mycena latifolia]